MRFVMVFVVGLFTCTQQLKPQVSNHSKDSLSVYLSFEECSSLGFLLPYFPPFFIQYGIELKSFIRNRTFQEIRQNYGDLKAVDAIFIKAMKLTSDNTAVALLISSVACFDHRIFGFKVPVFSLFFPLSNESKEEFNQRVENLPKRIYIDSPSSRIGDRDKLQHFFGSAFLTYVFESDEAAERFSDFIEKGEKAVIVDGVLDGRDIRANRNGQKFGLALLINKHRMPSQYFEIINN